MISRFCFNISLFENIKNIFQIPFFKDKEYERQLKNELSKIYDNSNIYFFDYGRTSFYEILSYIKKKTNKKKILINSLTLFEIINVIIYSGFEPVFIDNQKNSFQTKIDFDESRVDLDNVAAIVVTHLNGVNEDIQNIIQKLTSHNTSNKNNKVYLVEDCAVGFGSELNGKNVGTLGDFSFLSFNIMKNITSYTGGVLIDNLKAIPDVDKFNYKKLSKIHIIKKILFVILIQLLNSKIFFPIFFKVVRYSHIYSFNFFLKKYRADFEVKIEDNFPKRFSYFMHSFQKKILLGQLEDYKDKQISRIEKSKFYFNSLKNINYLNFPQTEFNSKNIFLDFPIICNTLSMKEKLFRFLLDKNIDVKNYYYKNCSAEKIYNSNDFHCINTSDISNNILMLPVHRKISDADQSKIVREIKNFFNHD
tara:strand:+ start:149 stop:1408 length:1260 start_codon:yes stop_codon:yes gene_type:complete